jgi:AraC family transcriptional regulator
MELKLSSGNFSGAALKNRDVSDLVLVESYYKPNLKLQRHSHANACFCLVIEGTFEDIYGSRQRTCQPSTLLFRPSGESHLDYFQSVGARCFNIELKPHFLTKLNEHTKLNNESVELLDRNLIMLAKRLYGEFRLMDEVSLLAIEGLSLEMLAGFSRNFTQKDKSQIPAWLKKAKDIIHDRFTETFSVAELAQSVSVHPGHLSRSFRRYYRLTIADYVRQLRIEYACHQISKSKLPLSQIALDLGFSHQSHFSNIFKRLTGFTPAQYRLNFRHVKEI